MKIIFISRNHHLTACTSSEELDVKIRVSGVPVQIFSGRVLEENMSRKYDLITIFRENDKTPETKKALLEMITHHNASVEKEEEWGSRKLYHEADHETSGFFLYNVINIEPDKVKNLTHDLQINQGILRYMIRALD